MEAKLSENFTQTYHQGDKNASKPLIRHDSPKLAPDLHRLWRMSVETQQMGGYGMKKAQLALVAGATVLAIALVGPAFADPVTIGFDGAIDLSAPVTESGFVYSVYSGDLLLAGGAVGGNKTLTGGGGVLEIVSATPGETFDYVGVDFGVSSSATGSGRTLTLSVEGLLGGSMVAHDSYDLSVDTPSAQTEDAVNLAGIPVDELLIYLPVNNTFFGGFDLSAIDNLRLNTLSARAEVPEPGTLALLGSGLVGSAFLRRRKPV